MSSLQHPTVTDNFDGQIFAIDAAIRVAAENWQFRYKLDVPKFEDLDRGTPALIYGLATHFSKRGFNPVYDGEAGTMELNWSHPNFTWLEAKQITRATPTMIPSLGVGFRASLLYMCMTNNVDLRSFNGTTVMRDLKKNIREAALLGNTQMCFGFPDVPAPAVGALYSDILDELIDSGFNVEFDVNNNVYLIKWGQTMIMNARSGEEATTLLI